MTGEASCKYSSHVGNARIRDSKGDPVAGADVQMNSTDSRFKETYRTQSDSEGWAVLSGVRQGYVYYRVNAAGHAELRGTMALKLGGGYPQIALEPAASSGAARPKEDRRVQEKLYSKSHFVQV